MKTDILKMLRECDGYVSGQRLCEHFGVSRTAVWKIIHQLEEEGYQVEAVRNKGYRIVEHPDVMTEEELGSLIGETTNWAGRNICYFPETDSTNIQAKRLGESGAPHGTLVVAEKQNAGRGRRGRGWNSPEGSSIYMSILLRPEFPPEKASMLTLVAAYGTALALRSCTGLEVQIKWPNDIVVRGKKLVGILTEMSTEIDYINHVVIGIGINVNMEAFPEEIAKTATSLRRELGHGLKRAPIAAEVMRQFEKNYEQFLRFQNLSFLQEAYNKFLVNCGQEVRILNGEDSYRAYALGINDHGELLVRRKDGTEETVYAGEVSVRGVYGYV